MTRKGGFKNIKLGKNVYRQMKRRGPPENDRTRRKPKPPPKKSSPFPVPLREWKAQRYSIAFNWEPETGNSFSGLADLLRATYNQLAFKAERCPSG
jgi:hypothetical protein